MENAILEKLPPASAEEPPDEAVMKVAIVGRRNVGKSTLVNTLAQAERMITSEIPGTTRDSVDVRFELDGKAFMAIDTPGFRRSKSITTNVDFYSTHRAQRSIRRADVVLLFFDATQRISKVDKQLCDYIAQQYKPCIFVVNKWDLVAGSMPTEKWVTYLRDTFPHGLRAHRLHHGPVGQKCQGHAQSRPDVVQADAAADRHVAVEQAVAGGGGGTMPRPLFRAAARASIMARKWPTSRPPSCSFCSDPKAVSQQYQRYLSGACREQMGFGEVPVKLYLRQREQSDRRDDIDARIAKEVNSRPDEEPAEEEN